MTFDETYQVELARCCRIAKDAWGFMGSVSVKCDLAGLVAGQARYPSTIRLNRVMLERAGDEAIRSTTAHEFAHIVCHALWRGHPPHGWQWQQIMRRFGHPPERCHSYEAHRASIRASFAFACECGQTFQMSERVKRKVDAGFVYRCRQCGTRIRQTCADDRGLSEFI